VILDYPEGRGRRKRRISMKKISTQEFLEMMKKNPSLKMVNVLPTRDYRREHIPGSFNVPVEEEDFEKKVEGWVETKSEPVVVYCECESDEAAPIAAERLEQAGFAEVYDYEGGLASWRKATYKV